METILYFFSLDFIFHSHSNKFIHERMKLRSLEKYYVDSAPVYKLDIYLLSCLISKLSKRVIRSLLMNEKKLNESMNYLLIRQILITSCLFSNNLVFGDCP